MSLWLIGSGSMARDYAKVLQALHVPFEVIGRGELSARRFEAEIGKVVFRGGLEQALKVMQPPRRAIVAVGIDQLACITALLATAGTGRILLEKPGGLDIAELNKLELISAESSTQVLIAYNRRFYASTIKARELVCEDGGILSAHFEFTEWSHEIAPLIKGAGVKDRWLLGNSSHVIDLAFHLCGVPSDWRCWHDGSLAWHPTSARFCGAGITKSKVMFSYFADWESPGRWGLEVLTSKRRLVMRPMEHLLEMLHGSVSSNQIEINDTLDRKYKPGLYLQVETFLREEDRLFCTLKEQIENVKIYNEMAGYN